MNESIQGNGTKTLEFTFSLGITYFSMLIMALIPIVFGSFLSVFKGDSKGDTEVMSKHDAMMFPIIGSCVLFGLYLLFKFFSKEYINMLLTAYFLLLGFVSLSKTISPLIRMITQTSKNLGQFTIPAIPFVLEKPFVVKFGFHDVISWIVSVVLIYFYVTTKGWILNNILGLSFSIQGIAMLSLGSYTIGCILLGGLFFYDIFWVFGTDVMVTVAKSFDAPIKLLFPKDIFAEVFEFSMLGLGDIVIPGIFIALLLRYDAFRATKGKTRVPKGPWSKPYFISTFVGYILGLATTIFVMHTFQHAQPALLYLVPGCIGSSFLTALALGDVQGLLNFSEEEAETKGKDLKK